MKVVCVVLLVVFAAFCFAQTTSPNPSPSPSPSTRYPGYCPSLLELCLQYPQKDYIVQTVTNEAGYEANSYFRYRYYYDYYTNSEGYSQPTFAGFRIYLLQNKTQPFAFQSDSTTIDYLTAGAAGCVEAINYKDLPDKSFFGGFPSNITRNEVVLRSRNSTFMPNSIEVGVSLANGGLVDYFLVKPSRNISAQEPYPNATFYNMFSGNKFVYQNSRGNLPIRYQNIPSNGTTNQTAYGGSCSDLIANSSSAPSFTASVSFSPSISLSNSRSPSSAPSLTPSISLTASISLSISISPSSLASASNTPSNSPSNSPSATVSPTPSSTTTASLSASVSLTSTATSSVSNTASSSLSSSATPSVSSTPSPSNTPSNSASNTPSNSASNSASNTPSNSPSNSPSNTASNTPSNTASISTSSTPSNTPSNSPSSGASVSSTSTTSVTPSVTNSRSLSATASTSPSLSASKSLSASRTTTPSLTSSRSFSTSRSNSRSLSPSRSRPPSVSPSRSRKPKICPQVGIGFIKDFYGATFNLGLIPAFSLTRDDIFPDTNVDFSPASYWKNGDCSHVSFSWNVQTGQTFLNYTAGKYVGAGSLAYNYQPGSAVGNTVVAFCSSILTVKADLTNVVINGVGGRICDLSTGFGLLAIVGQSGEYDGDLTPGQNGLVTVEADVEFTWFGSGFPTGLAKCGFKIERVGGY